jgi:ATP-dependent Clp protease ATP-binding subunit ClpA
VVSFLRSKRANVEEIQAELQYYIDSHPPLIPQDSEVDIVPTVGFQRVLQRSLYQAQAAQKNTVYAMNVLVSIFAEKESYAVYLLKLNNISRLEVMEAISTQMPELEEESPKIKSRPKKVKHCVATPVETQLSAQYQPLNPVE